MCLSAKAQKKMNKRKKSYPDVVKDIILAESVMIPTLCAKNLKWVYSSPLWWESSFSTTLSDICKAQQKNGSGWEGGLNAKTTSHYAAGWRRKGVVESMLYVVWSGWRLRGLAIGLWSSKEYSFYKISYRLKEIFSFII